MARLHQLLEHHDEYERDPRGFFLAEQDRRDPAAPPVLIYVRPDHVAGAKDPGPRPPDWIGEVLDGAEVPSRLERYARAGVAEYWRVRVDPALPGGIGLEVCLDPDREAGAYRQVRAVAPHEQVPSPTWEGLRLRPADLLARDEAQG